MKKMLSLILSAVMLLSLFAGCAAEDKPYEPTGNALVAEDADLDSIVEESTDEIQEFSLAYYPDRSLNPFTCNDYTNRTLFSLIYQSLFSVSRNYEAVPVLCESYFVSTDYRQYTIYIAPAVFSDGTSLTINDVIVSYQTAQECDYYSGRFTHVNDISLTDDGGIKFSLNVPMEDFPLLLDIPIVKASEVEAAQPVGTGPYILEGTVAGAQLRRNMAWWCQEKARDLAVTAESISLVKAESPKDIRDQFEFYDVGLVCADPCADNYADFRCDYELWDCENGIFVYLGCNVAYSQNDIFADTRLRSALTYAIDRERLVEENYRGFARATTLPCSPLAPYYSSGLASKYEYDPVTFINALGNAKRTDEPLRLLVNQDDSLRLRTARDIADMLNELGLDTQTLEVGTREYYQIFYAGTYDLYVGSTRLSANMDLSAFYKPWGDMSYNGMSDATIYEYCLDALENHGNYYTLHKAVAEDGRIVPILFCGYAVYADRGLLTELQPSRDNVFFYTLGKTAADAELSE